MPSDRTRVVLLVQGFEENPMAIGRILGLQSSESWFKGDLVYERASVRGWRWSLECLSLKFAEFTWRRFLRPFDR